MNSYATWRLNAMLWERCLGIGFYRSNAQPTGQSWSPDLSGLRGALHRGAYCAIS